MHPGPWRMAAPQIDRKHGFLKGIIKNQVERDEYHRANTSLNELLDPTNSHRTVNVVNDNRRERVVDQEVEREVDTKLPARTHDAYNWPSSSSSSSKRRRVADDDNDDRLGEAIESNRWVKTNDIGAEYRSRMRQQAVEDIRRKHRLIASVPNRDRSPECRSSSGERRPLFRLELRDAADMVHSCVVYKGDSAARVAKAYCQKLKLPDTCAAKIRDRIQEKLDEMKAKKR